MKKILLIAATAVMMMACPPDPIQLDPNQKVDRDNLTAQTEPGIFEASNAVVTYNAEEHQLYCGVKQLTTRIMDNEVDGYAQIIFDKKPVLKQNVTATLYITKIGTSKNISTTFNVLKIQNDLIYIWSDKDHIGAVMYWKM